MNTQLRTLTRAELAQIEYDALMMTVEARARRATMGSLVLRLIDEVRKMRQEAKR